MNLNILIIVLHLIIGSSRIAALLNSKVGWRQSALLRELNSIRQAFGGTPPLSRLERSHADNGATKYVSWWVRSSHHVVIVSDLRPTH